MDDDDQEQGKKGEGMKNLPEQQKSIQFDLFTAFYGDENKQSNTIELWDSIPKFSCSARKQVSMRDEAGRLPSLEREFVYKPQGSSEGIPAKMRLAPALVKVNGIEKDFYPSADEELIEEVLRKIFADQQHGRHYVKQNDSFVDFSLGMIARELRARGRARSLDEIKRSLDIMNGCHMTLHFHGSTKKAAYKGAIIPEMMEVSRIEYMADPKAKWRARLPLVYSHAINSLEFRQFNYETLMSMSSQLARWLHKLMSRRYTNASLTRPYTIKYSTIKRDSGMLVHSRETENKKTVIKAIEELKAQDVVLYYKERDSTNDPRDPVYDLTPTGCFVGDMKAANKRQADHQKYLPDEKRPISHIGKAIEDSKHL